MKKEALVRPFPENLIKTRKGAFGNRLSYVEGSHYIARLNDALNFEWSFEIVEHHVKGREMVVLGKLTAGNVSKMAFGGSPITMSRESGEIVSQADDLKSAATDALKKACSLLGVGLHLYGNTEPARRASANGPSKGDGRPGNGLPGSRRSKHACLLTTSVSKLLTNSVGTNNARSPCSGGRLVVAGVRRMIALRFELDWSLDLLGKRDPLASDERAGIPDGRRRPLQPRRRNNMRI